MTNLIPRIQNAMKDSYERVYSFRSEYKSYLEAYEKVKTTNFEDL